MKLLVIGDALSQFTTNFTIALKALDNKIIVDIINIQAVSDKELIKRTTGIYHRVYNNQSKLGFIENVPKLRGIIRLLFAARVINEVNRNIDTYDAILLHGFWKQNCKIFKKLRTNNIFSIGAIWGSDFYKREQSGLLIFETMDICDRLIISTNDMIRDVSEVKNIYRDKIRNCLFGLVPLEILFKNQKLTAKEAKQCLGFNESDFIITCGYNGSPNQQHLEIIKAIVEIKGQLPDNYKLVLPMTYGGGKAYKGMVKEILLKHGLNHIIYEDFLTDREIVYLRIATSVFIQTQKTDAFSGSMQEHLFAQNIVITGAWLSYQSLREKGIYYETIDCMKLLSDKLSFVIKNQSKIYEEIKNWNTPIKFKSSLWSECIKDWYAVLNEYRNL